MFAGVLLLSANATTPPLAIVTLLAGGGFDPDPGVAQHGQLLSTQFSFTSSLTSEDAASAGSTTSAAPSKAATGRSNSLRSVTANHPFLVLQRIPGTSGLHGACRREAGYPTRTPLDADSFPIDTSAVRRRYSRGGERAHRWRGVRARRSDAHARSALPDQAHRPSVPCGVGAVGVARGRGGPRTGDVRAGPVATTGTAR